ncbi:hypothetical protein [Bordetella bronchiseptica]|uniref:hypothetical protein n=1 Tax=Bordetella bronchiseptica TaxID=518 RepID=UPI000461366F|nr:hypothetical protein [Bordetella bronchiseptica]KDD27832.1 hypothetical protein L525_0546 [Bordetella bronchiseptica MBORD782]VTQ95020.1 Uncharacterised protein [Bordetella bronchiseptica]
MKSPHPQDRLAGRGVYIQRAPAERMTVEAALTRYLKKVTPTKRASTQAGEHKKAQVIIRHLGKYSLAALNAAIRARSAPTRWSTPGC